MTKSLFCRKPLALSILLLIAIVVGGCGKKTDVTGHWEGPIDMGAFVNNQGKTESTLHLVLDIRNEGGRLKATILSLELHDDAVLANAVKFTNVALKFTFHKRNDTY